MYLHFDTSRISTSSPLHSTDRLLLELCFRSAMALQVFLFSHYPAVSIVIYCLLWLILPLPGSYIPFLLASLWFRYLYIAGLTFWNLFSGRPSPPALLTSYFLLTLNLFYRVLVETLKVPNNWSQIERLPRYQVLCQRGCILTCTGPQVQICVIPQYKYFKTKTHCQKTRKLLRMVEVHFVRRKYFIKF